VKRSLVFVSVLIIITGAFAGFVAHAEPSSHSERRYPGMIEILGAGTAMGIGSYFLGVTLHEASHAALATAFGAQVTDFQVLPQILPDGSVLFGSTSYVGNLNRDQEAIVLLGPKFLDLAIMGTYIGLFEGGVLPRHPIAHLPFVVMATASWVDFAKDIFSTNPNNDLVRVYDLYGLRDEESRLAFRVVHAGLALAAAVEIGRGWYRVFSSAGAPVDPGRHREPRVRGGRVSPVIGPGGIGIGGTF
jgi:hypothetical protein